MLVGFVGWLFCVCWVSYVLVGWLVLVVCFDCILVVGVLYCMFGLMFGFTFGCLCVLWRVVWLCVYVVWLVYAMWLWVCL